MGGPARARPTAEFKAEIGITIPCPLVKSLRSAVGEELSPPVAPYVYANGVADEDKEKIGRDGVNDVSADSHADSGAKAARGTAGLTCAAAAGRRCLPRMPLRLQDASSYQRQEKEPGVRPF
eukprot:4010838-Pyramimonas_sp.AAC.1